MPTIQCSSTWARGVGCGTHVAPFRARAQTVCDKALRRVAKPQVHSLRRVAAFATLPRRFHAPGGSSNRSPCIARGLREAAARDDTGAAVHTDILCGCRLVGGA